MPSVNLLSDITYTLEYVPAGGRNTRTKTVLEAIPLSIATIQEREAPVVMEAFFAPEWTQDVMRNRALPIRVFEGALVTRPYGADDQPRPVRSLSSIEGGPRMSWKANEAYPFKHPQMKLHCERLNESPQRVEEIRPRLVKASTRDEAVAYANEVAAKVCVIGEELWIPLGVISWLNTNHGGLNHIRASVSPYQTFGTTYPGYQQPVPRFAPGHLEEANEHARWLNERRVNEGHPELEILTRGSFQVLEADLMPDPYLSLALASFGSLPERSWGDAFSKLPTPVLRSWADFREAVDAMRTGDAASVPQAFTALEAMCAGLPANPSEDLVMRSGLGSIERVGREMVRYHDTYLSRLAPTFDLTQDDIAEISMLRP